MRTKWGKQQGKPKEAGRGWEGRAGEGEGNK